MATTETTVESEKLTGNCKWFNAKKGFGFITRADGEGDVFVHQTGIHAEGFRSLLEGEDVEFNLTKDAEDRLKAIDVTGPEGAFVKGAPKPGQRRRRRRNDNRQRRPRNPRRGDDNGEGEAPADAEEPTNENENAEEEEKAPEENNSNPAEEN